MLEEAYREGEVQIRREDSRVYAQGCEQANPASALRDFDETAFAQLQP